MRKTLRSPAHARLVELLKRERLGAGLTQQAVADRLGAPQSFLAKIEGGERRLDVLEFIALARALEANPVELFGRVLDEAAKAQPKGRRKPRSA